MQAQVQAAQAAQVAQAAHPVQPPETIARSRATVTVTPPWSLEEAALLHLHRGVLATVLAVSVLESLELPSLAARALAVAVAAVAVAELPLLAVASSLERARAVAAVAAVA